MGLIHIEMFATLGLVGQAPGGPDEDPAGFPYGGWQAPLLRERLFDRLDLWVHPIVLGVGKKVFDGGAVPTNLALLEPPAAGPEGTVYLRYARTDGTPATGDMSAPDRGLGHDDAR
ncbi:hypothetical protein ACGFZP_21900 [Kitasatospora sp. NPDC048239]|uniref:hypothetical protein n=1 Tax=Kitasatospora sp. NPDC048239 TaxID=3364046 RepID=UPI0037165179